MCFERVALQNLKKQLILQEAAQKIISMRELRYDA